jgi:hypothetical protein
VTKTDLLLRGIENATAFCAVNNLAMPEVNARSREEWHVGACAYYRPVYIEICPQACAAIGREGRAWSYPGYSVDRTPFGVVAHELGHHADHARSQRRGPYFGDYSIRMRAAAREEPLTSYCPNDAEWFAEMFRLFVTNPDLLRLIRPATHDLIAADFKPSVTAAWADVLAGAPERTIIAASRKIEEARKRGFRARTSTSTQRTLSGAP